jgi:glycosyltransferase involved in cell wall biosynthesis
MVLREHPVHLLVVGEFWSSPAFYWRYAQEFGAESAITFVNRYVPNEELKRYFDLADVVVLPYVSATQSAVVQLAFGFGKPVITTRVGGLHEVVKDGETGLIVPPQDSAALAAAIVRYLSEGLDEELERNVRRTAEAQTYSWQQLVSTIEAIQQSWEQQ